MPKGEEPVAEPLGLGAHATSRALAEARHGAGIPAPWGFSGGSSSGVNAAQLLRDSDLVAVDGCDVLAAAVGSLFA